MKRKDLCITARQLDVSVGDDDYKIFYNYYHKGRVGRGRVGLLDHVTSR